MIARLSRRALLGRAALAGWSLAALSPAGLARSPERADAHLLLASPRQRLAAAWRSAAPGPGESADRVGILAVDWEAGTVQVQADLPAPGRAHGLLALADGGFLAVAARPGRWLLRCDRDGRVMQRVLLDDERPARTLTGHVEPSADGRWLYSGETDPGDGSGWLGVRDAATLRRVAEWRLPGLDPHQMLLDDDGRLLLALGGIPRNAAGRKVQLDRMDPSLLRLDPASGTLLGQWRLDDPRLSLRHLAWSQDAQGRTRLGVALQAEHDDPALRRRAPALAVWEGERLQLPNADAQAGGYAGDIAAGPGGGFVISAEKTERGLWWQPGAAGRMTPIAELGQACALSTWLDDAGQEGVLLAAQQGLARWHPGEPPRLLPWPQAMAPDNHWVLLG
ncbi:MAG: DUF1513 domain-containing protein [Burkholderiaceae bacterium]|nr:DUF1513 domain-containing protein [Burkholderiaceae bacterium]